ncbi:MAG: hypothetical protein V1860_02465 [bacterium]
MIHFLVKTIYFWIIGFFLAILEIQIEGEHGWAAKLPTWRAKPGGKLDKIFKKLAAEKDLTGYHIVLMTFILLVFHLPFIWSWQWNILSELELLSFFILFAAVWDFLWFVLNPNFSLRTFNPERVWWHKKWIGKFPTDYYIAVLLCVLFLLPEMIITGGAVWHKIVSLLGVNLILTVLSVIFYPQAY